MMGLNRKLPGFIIIGSMKSGTTTLYCDLRMSPELYLPSKKEPAILTKYDSVEKIRKAYKEHFTCAGKDQLCGEASTVYTKLPMHEGVAEKALKICGNQLKLIMIMRDPVERIYSHLKHDIANGYINHDQIDASVLSDYNYIAISDYSMQLEPWVNAFGSENILCISFKELKKNRQAVLCKALKFLGITVGKTTFDFSIPKNRSADLRITSKSISLLINSKIYKKRIRPLISDMFRERLRNSLLKKANIPEVILKPETETILRQKLAHVQKSVEILIGERIEI